MSLFETFGDWATGAGDFLGGVVGFLSENLDDIGAIAGGISGIGENSGGKSGTSQKNLYGAGLHDDLTAPSPPAGTAGLDTSVLLLFVGALVVVLLVAKR